MRLRAHVRRRWAFFRAVVSGTADLFSITSGPYFDDLLTTLEAWAADPSARTAAPVADATRRQAAFVEGFRERPTTTSHEVAGRTVNADKLRPVWRAHGHHLETHLAALRDLELAAAGWAKDSETTRILEHHDEMVGGFRLVALSWKAMRAPVVAFAAQIEAIDGLVARHALEAPKDPAESTDGGDPT